MKLISFLLRIAKTTGGKFYNFIASRGREGEENLIILLGIFGALSINYFQGYSGSFIFEVEFLNQIAFHFTMLIPLLLLYNSLLLKKNWAGCLSPLIFIIPAFIIFFIYLDFVKSDSLFHTQLVRRFPESKEYVLSVYENGRQDNGYLCGAWVRQKKVFPGILRNKELIHECKETLYEIKP